MIRHLKILLLSGLLLVGFGVATTAPVAAFDLFGDPCSGGSGASSATVCKDAKKSQTQQSNSIWGPGGIVGKIVLLLSIVIAVAAVIVIIIAGIQYMLSQGDPTKVSNAKNAIIYALVGLAVAVLSQAIIRFVASKL